MAKRALSMLTEAVVDPTLLGRYTWTVADLASKFPPRWSHPNKIAVAAIAMPPGTKHEGSVTVSRWVEAGFPPRVKKAPVHSGPGFYIYPVPDSNSDATTHWHLNFADPYLFGYGEGPLLAQDELQITEHPCLASAAHAIEEGSHGMPGLRRLTRENGRTTPVLIKGAPRRCYLDAATTDLYGDNFAFAFRKSVEEATTPLDPPTISNIVAIAADSGGVGKYNEAQIRKNLEAAYTGFRATVLESEGGRVTLHTGHWGCGAFGGNKGLMATIQILAAGAAEVERVHFWYGFAEMDRTALQHGIQIAEALDGMTTDEAVARLEGAGYCWGLANENYVPFEPPSNCILSQHPQEL